MNKVSRRESQNRVSEAARRLKELLELEHSNNISTVDVSYYKSNLISLEMEIEVAKNCGDTGPHINRLLDQLQPVRDQLFECELAFIKQEQDKAKHQIELIRAFRELVEALESTPLVMISSSEVRLRFTLPGFLRYAWLCLINKKIEARYIVCENYSLECLSRLVFRAKDRLYEES